MPVQSTSDMRDPPGPAKFVLYIRNPLYPTEIALKLLLGSWKKSLISENLLYPKSTIANSGF